MGYNYLLSFLIQSRVQGLAMFLLNSVGTAASSLFYHKTAAGSEVSKPVVASTAMPNVPLCCTNCVRQAGFLSTCRYSALGKPL